METRTVEKTSEAQRTGPSRKPSGARPYTGLEAIWDKFDGFQASITIAGSMAATVLLVGLILNIVNG